MTNFNIIHILAPNVLAGAERVVITGLNQFVNNGYKVTIILIKEARSPQHVSEFKKNLNEKINIVEVESKNALDLKLIKNLRHEIKKLTEKEKIIIHTHGYKALIMTKIAIFNGNIPFFHTHHGNTSHTFKVKAYEWLALQFMKHTTNVICVSEKMKIELSKSLPLNKLTIIENMLSFKNIDNITSKRLNKMESSSINLIFVGRLSPEKGALHFIKNYNSFIHKDLIKIDILGDGPEMADIKKFLKDNHLEEKIKLIGFINDPSEYFIKADALIMPSFTEGMPMTLIESLCSGVPVIANDVGAISELLKDKYNGILLRSNSEINWHGALEYFISNKVQIQNNTQENAPAIQSKYSAQTWMTKSYNLYLNYL